MIVSVCYNIILAIVMQKILDAIAYRNRESFYQGVVIALSSFAVAFLFEPPVSRMRNHCVRNTISQIRENVFDAITQMPVKTYEAMERGDILTKITNDIETLEEIYLFHLQLLAFALIHGGIAMVLMLFYSVPLGILSIFLGILQSFINYRISGRVEQASENRRKSRAAMIQTVVDTLDGRVDIRLSGGENFFRQIFSGKNSGLSDHERSVEKKKVLIENIDNFFENLNYVAILGVGLYMVLSGNITLGVIAAMKSLQGNANYLFSNLSSFMSGMAETLPSAVRIEEILNMEQAGIADEVLHADAAMRTDTDADMQSDTAAQTALEMRDIFFGYNSCDEILRGLSCRIENGKLALITGNSGEGKTTWLKLLLGFYDFSRGRYLLFGQDVPKSDRLFIVSRIAYVDQSCSLFSMSVADNVRLGRLNATDEEIVKACQAADAHEFIENLPDKYDTVLTGGGTNLSGGQRQRIALARAFVSLKPILLIDEGTASLDVLSEQKIIESIVKMKGKRTVIVVSHRKAWEECADEIYHLCNGGFETLQRDYFTSQ